MMRQFTLLTFCLFLIGCASEPEAPSSTTWRGVLDIGQDQSLNFIFDLNLESDTPMVIYNGDEHIILSLTDIKRKGDSLRIDMPVFESYFMIHDLGDKWEGSYKDPGRRGDYTIPFSATPANRRYDLPHAKRRDLPGIWTVRFSPDTEDEYPAMALLEEDGEGRVTGTFRTETGDYRYLDGMRSGDELVLSTFDGAHAFLFTATITGDSLSGTFFSGNHYQEPWTAVADPEASLGNPDELTYLKEGYDGIEFSFPGLLGDSIRYPDAAYEGKVVVIQILGSWCPNCMDETRLFAEWYDEYHDRGLEIVGLTFERRPDMEDARVAVQKMKDRLGADYDMAIASLTTSKTVAAEKLPMLSAVLSYPTSIWIDRSGEIRKIHTGFNGPGTGTAYEEFVEEYQSLIEEMLEE